MNSLKGSGGKSFKSTLDPLFSSPGLLHKSHSFSMVTKMVWKQRTSSIFLTVRESIWSLGFWTFYSLKYTFISELYSYKYLACSKVNCSR